MRRYFAAVALALGAGALASCSSEQAPTADVEPPPGSKQVSFAVEGMT